MSGSHTRNGYVYTQTAPVRAPFLTNTATCIGRSAWLEQCGSAVVCARSGTQTRDECVYTQTTPVFRRGRWAWLEYTQTLSFIGLLFNTRYALLHYYTIRTIYEYTTSSRSSDCSSTPGMHYHTILLIILFY